MSDRMQFWGALLVALGAGVLVVAHVVEERWVWAVVTAAVAIWGGWTARVTRRRL